MNTRERCAWALSGLLVTTLLLGGGYQATNYDNGDVNGDGGIDISDPIYLLAYLFEGGPEPVTIHGLIPATGQTECYEFTLGPGWESVPCDDPSVTQGQDGSTQIGAPLEGRFLENLDGTVTDQATGLMWASEMISPGTWYDSLSYCESLQLAGHGDWRMPNINELQSVLIYDRPWPPVQTGSSYYNVWFHPDYFSHPTGGQQRVWSSTTTTLGGPGASVDLGAVFIAVVGDGVSQSGLVIRNKSKGTGNGQDAVWAVRGPVN